MKRTATTLLLILLMSLCIISLTACGIFADVKTELAPTLPTSASTDGDVNVGDNTGDDDKIKPKEELAFTLSDDGTYYIVSGIGTVKGGDIVIPSTYKGLPVTVIGNGAFLSCNDLTSVVIPDSVTTLEFESFGACLNLKNVTLGKGLVTIDVSAFNGCKKLASITIPDSVITIGSMAFGECTDLSSVTLGSSVKAIENDAFYRCTSLKKIEFPNSLTTIGQYAFAQCDFTSLTIPNSVTTVGTGAFSGCRRLNSVVLSENMSTLDGIFEGCGFTSFVIPEGITTIGEGAFSNCELLTSVVIPDSVTTIGRIAFASCKRLQSVVIPESVATIGEDAFSDCVMLTDIVIPDSVTTIGNNAFKCCYNLTRVTIGNKVTEIGENAFEYCYKLVEVLNRSALNITAEAPEFGNIAYYAKQVITDINESNIITKGDYIFYNDNGKYYLVACAKLSNVLTLPQDINDMPYGIYNYAFFERSELTTVNLPDVLTSIGIGAFYNCTNVTDLTLPKNMKAIDNYAFWGCGITNIVIPYGVTTIGEGAFIDCKNLTSIVIPSSVNTIHFDAFKDSDLTSVTFENANGWVITRDIEVSGTPITLTDPKANAKYLTTTYNGMVFIRH